MQRHSTERVAPRRSAFSRTPSNWEILSNWNAFGRRIPLQVKLRDGSMIMPNVVPRPHEIVKNFHFLSFRQQNQCKRERSRILAQVQRRSVPPPLRCWSACMWAKRQFRAAGCWLPLPRFPSQGPRPVIGSPYHFRTLADPTLTSAVHGCLFTLNLLRSLESSPTLHSKCELCGRCSVLARCCSARHTLALWPLHSLSAHWARSRPATRGTQRLQRRSFSSCAASALVLQRMASPACQSAS